MPQFPKLPWWATFGLSVVIFLTILLVLSPSLLVYSENPEKSDAILLLVGPVTKARRQYANELLDTGYGKVLLIPAFNQALDREGKRIPCNFTKRNKTKNYTLASQSGNSTRDTNISSLLCQYMEDTHRELLRGRKMMEALDIHSVNIVSSPYHLRRIKFISEHVFEHYPVTIHLTPTPYGPQPVKLWWTDRDQRWWVLNEWIKLIWFFIYSPFCSR